MENKTNTLLKDLNVNNPEAIAQAAETIYQQMQSEGKSVQEVMNISDDFLEQVYGVGYSYYNLGKNKEALSLFHFLISIQPQSAKYMFGFSATLYQMKDFENAALGFCMAYANNQEDPLAAYQTADCLLKLNQPQEATLMLDQAIKAAGNKKAHSVLKERCILIKNNINQ